MNIPSDKKRECMSQVTKYCKIIQVKKKYV